MNVGDAPSGTRDRGVHLAQVALGPFRRDGLDPSHAHSLLGLRGLLAELTQELGAGVLGDGLAR
jgi:hypothetical protein